MKGTFKEKWLWGGGEGVNQNGGEGRVKDRQSQIGRQTVSDRQSMENGPVAGRKIVW